LDVTLVDITALRREHTHCDNQPTLLASNQVLTFVLQTSSAMLLPKRPRPVLHRSTSGVMF